MKYWIKPDIENRIKAGQVKAYFNSTVKEITPDHVVLKTPDGEVTLANDWVFALTGYHPDFEFLCRLGIQTSRRCRQEAGRESARRWKAMCRAFIWQASSLRACAPVRSSSRTGAFTGRPSQRT